MPETYTLSRDGQRPVQFSGEMLAEELGHHNEYQRYYNLALYQAENRRYVVEWHYCSQWTGEQNHYAAETYATMDAAIAALEAFDPTAWVEGFRHLIAQGVAGAAEHYVPRQAQLERQIRERYQAQVSALCQALDVVEEL